MSVDIEQQLTALRMANAVTSLDLQLYKGSVYKLRWGSPGGLDHAIPCYEEAARVIESTPWSSDLRKDADTLAEFVDKYLVTLRGMDVTTASTLHSKMIACFETIRDTVRTWPSAS
jgi:hypothetical protein